MSKNLKAAELLPYAGLNTQVESTDLSGRFLRVAQNVDAFAKFRAIGKIPGSTRVSADHGGPVVSLHQFEFVDLDLVRKRQQIDLANVSGTAILNRIESDLSLTALTSGATFPIAAERLVDAKMLDKLFLSSAGQVNLKTGGIKYDGTKVTNWGIKAPGTTETTKLAFDSLTGWAASAAATLSLDTVTFRQGSGSFKVGKVSHATEAFARVTGTGLALNLANSGQDLAFIYLFVPSGGLQKLASSGAAVELFFGDAGFVNSSTYTFPVGKLLPGWNLLSWNPNVAESFTGSGAPLLSIDSVRLGLNFLSASTVQDNFHWDFLHTTDESRITVGAVVTNTVIEGFNATAGFGPTYSLVEGFNALAGFISNADTVLSLNTTTKVEGAGSIELDKTGVATVNGVVTKLGGAFNFGVEATDILRFQIFAPTGFAAKLAVGSASIQFTGGNIAGANYDQWRFPNTAVTDGIWNTFEVVLSTPTASTGTGIADFANVPDIQVDFTLVSAATTATDVLVDNLFRRGNTISLNATTKTEGTNSIQVDKTAVNDDEVLLRKLNSSFSFLGSSDGKFRFDLFAPSGLKAKLSTGAVAVRIAIGSSLETTPNGLRWDFTFDKITDGVWNTLECALASPTATLGTGIADLGTVQDFAVTLFLFNESVTQTGILFDNLQKKSFTAGAITGQLSYRVTFLTESGVESNASFPSASVTVVNGKVDLTNIPVSADSQVIARRIYRDLAGDAVFRFVTQIDNNVTTIFTDSIGDASLGSATMPIAGDSALDSSPPGRLVDFLVHERRIVGIDADNRFTLKMSAVDSPETFRIVDELQLEDEIRALESHTSGTLVFGSDSTHLLSGDGVTSSLRLDRVNSSLGANSPKATARYKGGALVLHERDFFWYLVLSDPWLLNTPIYDKFRDLDLTKLDEAHVVFDRSRFRFVIFAKGTGSSTFNKVFVYQYGTQSSSQVTAEGDIDPLDARKGGWFEIVLPAGIDPRCSESIERNVETPELWVGGGDGFVYWLQDPSKKDYANGLGSAPVNAIIEWHPVPLGETPLGRGEPRFLKFHSEASVVSTWEITISIGTETDGIPFATAVFSKGLSGKTAPILSIPSMGTRAEWCTVRLSNNNTLEDGIFKSLALIFIPRASTFRGSRNA